MTAPTAPRPGPTASATGLLAEFDAAGVLAPADVHVATRLGRLGHETDEAVLLAAALAVRAVRMGSVCVGLGAIGASGATGEEGASGATGEEGASGATGDETADTTVLGEGDQLVDVSALPWPEPAAWLARCAASPLTAPDGPLHLTDDGADSLLYLDRYRRQEEQIRDELAARAAATPPPVDPDVLAASLDRLYGGDSGASAATGGDSGASAATGGYCDDRGGRQSRAAAVAALRWVSVLAGGPGTGKTTTVARMLALLLDQDPTLRIALAAPTGKAAARMTESTAAQAAALGDARLAGLAATTIHRLLGARPGVGSRFRHDRNRRLPVDVLVVDESSMVSLTLMARLFEAVRPDTRVVLVGDPDQLASVEAGAVLGDLTRAPGAPEPQLEDALRRAGVPGEPVVHGVTTLSVNHRFGAGIAALASAVRDGDADAAVAALRAGLPGVRFVETDALAEREPAGLEELRDQLVRGATETAHFAREGDVERALEVFDRQRLLCAHRRGPYGVARWAEQVRRWISADGPVDDGTDGSEWYPGRPLLVTENDHDLRLYNGDTGVVVATPAGLRAVFTRGERPLEVVPARLGEVTTVRAMTVHRAQGSQFSQVAVILPPPQSPLLTRELLYTAVTRARDGVRVVGSAEAVRAAVARPVGRASGLTRGL